MVSDERDDLVHEIAQRDQTIRAARRDYDGLARSSRALRESATALAGELTEARAALALVQDERDRLRATVTPLQDSYGRLEVRMLTLQDERDEARRELEEFQESKTNDVDDPTCVVHMDGQRRLVPWVPCCAMAARGWLGVPQGWSVKREEGRTGIPQGEVLGFASGFRFNTEERYVMADYVDPDEDLDDDPKAPWEQDPEGWKKP